MGGEEDKKQRGKKQNKVPVEARDHSGDFVLPSQTQGKNEPVMAPETLLFPCSGELVFPQWASLLTRLVGA